MVPLSARLTLILLPLRVHRTDASWECAISDRAGSSPASGDNEDAIRALTLCDTNSRRFMRSCQDLAGIEKRGRAHCIPSGNGGGIPQVNANWIHKSANYGEKSTHRGTSSVRIEVASERQSHRANSLG